MQELLFICTGNFYRSRFAEAVFNAEALRRAIPWRAFSRGLAVHLVSGDLSPHAVEALRGRGIDLALTGATRVALTEGDLRRASKIVALKEAEHRPLMRRLFPSWEARVEYWGIDDIDGASPAEALPRLEAQVLACLEDIAPARALA